jgi:tRNA(adenine34) deaminase
MRVQKLDDKYFMRQALQEAQRAMSAKEVPIGAVIVSENKVIARAHNLTQMLHDSTAHAEMQAFTAASDYLGGKYLEECTLYVTLEPCLMCAGAAFWTHIGKIVIGASDKKGGYQRFKSKVLHAKTNVKSGVMKEECEELLNTFFASRRK